MQHFDVFTAAKTVSALEAAQTLETLRICAEATGEQYWGSASLCNEIAER